MNDAGTVRYQASRFHRIQPKNFRSWPLCINKGPGDQQKEPNFCQGLRLYRKWDLRNRKWELQ